MTEGAGEKFLATAHPYQGKRLRLREFCRTMQAGCRRKNGIVPLSRSPSFVRRKKRPGEKGRKKRRFPLKDNRVVRKNIKN